MKFWHLKELDFGTFKWYKVNVNAKAICEGITMNIDDI